MATLRSTERFKPLEDYPTREQRIADLDRCLLWNYWLIEDGHHPAVMEKNVRERIDRLLDTRLFLMKHT